MDRAPTMPRYSVMFLWMVTMMAVVSTVMPAREMAKA